MNKGIIYIIVVFTILLSSCSATKHVPKDKYLLNKVKIDSDIKNQGEPELKQYLKQTPNYKSFGLFRIRLGIYNVSGRDTTKGFNRFWRKVGDGPSIYDEDLTEFSRLELKKYLQNKGYVEADVSYNVKLKRKRANVYYTVRGNTPYRLRDYEYAIRNDTILNFIRNDAGNSLVREGMLFDTDVLNNERQRVTNLLRRHGYYSFNKDHISYMADSTFNSHQVDVRMIMKPATRTDSVGAVIMVPQKQYTVREIRFFTHYDPITPTNITLLDSVVYNGYPIYYNKKMNLKPGLLVDNCHIEKGELYNEQQVDRTYLAMNSLSAIRYVNIRFREIREGSDTLDCSILISPATSQSYSFDVEGTNSTGDFGFAGSLSYQHKNLFKGSELFRISVRLAHESETESISDLLTSSSNEISSEASLTYPKFLFPLISSDLKKKIKASTEFKVGYNYQIRPDYSRTVASVGTKYLWTSNKNRHHIIDLIDINYVYLPYISDDFREAYLQSNSILKYSYENQLIASSGYTIRIGNQSARKQRDNFNVRMGIEGAGNLLYGLGSLLNFKKIDDSYTIANIKFAQYIKTDFDVSYDQYIDRRNNIVYHFGFGIGVPYGNMDVLPFEKRYISGGANSVRGWSVRTLGPGVYSPDNDQDIDYMNQSGDIKLDFNLEYRYKMFWIMEGALFADAGNVWTLQYYSMQPGGHFKFNRFYKQLALGYGIGIRFDFTYFLFRIDMGVKAFNPALEGSDKWRFKGLSWHDDFAFHFAVGYPF